MEQKKTFLSTAVNIADMTPLEVMCVSQHSAGELHESLECVQNDTWRTGAVQYDDDDDDKVRNWDTEISEVQKRFFVQIFTVHISHMLIIIFIHIHCS